MSATLAGLKSQIMDRMEAMESEIIALRCVTGLLNGQTPGANAIELSELSYIIDPIIEREKAILDEVREMFKEVGFTKAG
ncbi:hypothetical protein PL263_10430 [Methylomonas sp. EFPC3]|uniref:hypothetical protein n=1 Tax=Methylomonas sp. EFPC3 TaxID=3021710 RepID=UPI002417876B|nr:hypothetical protein [Methylomonas sp. EFPC3]WFP48529.1 hypothetical protein PL263_10430 [Methylomonas sp. EFPC3]